MRKSSAVRKDTRPEWVQELDWNRPKYEEVPPAVRAIQKNVLLRLAIVDPYEICSPESLLDEGIPGVLVRYLSYQHEEAPHRPGVHLQSLLETVANVFELREYEQYHGRGKRARQISVDLTKYVATLP